MKLFFETSAQAEAFLATVPLGFVLAAGFDITSALKKGRVLLDVLLLLGCAAALLLLLHLMRDGGLRAYHLLALCVGTLLYTRGVGSLLRLLVRRIQKSVRQGSTDTQSN